MKNKEQLVKIEALVGSLVIPPKEIKSVFKKLFKAGLKCNELHPDDSTYDSVHFNEALDKVLKSFYKRLPK